MKVNVPLSGCAGGVLGSVVMILSVSKQVELYVVPGVARRRWAAIDDRNADGPIREIDARVVAAAGIYHIELELRYGISDGDVQPG